ncbi:MAG: AAA family ATPase [Clostridia bacterium]|nr:AAA family ATPase [Clostridia bacterium]
MKIDRLTIASFGGLKDKTILLGDGLQVLYGQNEAGKTTVMNFLKMMFYGNEYSGSQIAKNMRKKYTPWDGSPMAGSVDFTAQGRRYRLEREFKSSNSTDRVFLMDLDLGTREAAPSDIGTRFFGLSAAAFERSVFIGQPGNAEKHSAAESELGVKLSNLITTGEESVSYNTVYSRLEKAKLALMSKSGRIGLYDKTVRRISEQTAELEKAEKALADYTAVRDAAKAEAGRLTELARKASALKEKIDAEQDIRNAQKLRELLKRKEELDRTNRELQLTDGGFVDELYVKKLDFCLRKVDLTAMKISEKTAEAEKLRKHLEQTEIPTEEISEAAAAKLAAEIESLENEKADCQNRAAQKEREAEAFSTDPKTLQKQRKRVHPLWLSAALVLLLAAAGLAFARFSLPAAGCAAAGAVFAVLAFLLRPEDPRKAEEFRQTLADLKAEAENRRRRETETNEALSEARGRLAYLRAALAGGATLAGQKALLEDCEQALTVLHEQEQKELSDLFSLLERFRPVRSVEEAKALLPVLSEQASAQKEKKQHLHYLARDLGNPSYEEVRSKLAALPEQAAEPVDFEAVKETYAALLQELSEKKAAISAAEAAAKAELKSVRNPEIIRRELDELREKAAAQADFCRAADLAMQTLSDSFALLRRGYGRALETKAAALFEDLTGGRYKDLRISKAFDICVERPDVFGEKESFYLSSGTEDQAYLSLRLALSELMTENGESLPLFLDDVLCRYDDARTTVALAFLKQYSQKGQTILFTCRGALQTEAERLGAVVTPL